MINYFTHQTVFNRHALPSKQFERKNLSLLLVYQTSCIFLLPQKVKFLFSEKVFLYRGLPGIWGNEAGSSGRNPDITHSWLLDIVGTHFLLPGADVGKRLTNSPLPSNPATSIHPGAPTNTQLVPPSPPRNVTSRHTNPLLQQEICKKCQMETFYFFWYSSAPKK